jgi:lipooligosaccharide transport system permease protein
MVSSSVLRVIEVNARNYKRTWRGSAITTFLSPVLFLAAMGVGLGTLVNSGAGSRSLDGVSYIAFIAPGLLAATEMQTAAGESAWPVMAGIKWLKTYHAALATPVGVSELVSGNLLWLAIRAILTGVVFVAVAVAFGAMEPARGLASIAPAVLTGMAFASPVTAYTAASEQETRLTALFRFGIIPMFLFSGTFFPVSQLPGWLRPVAYATPLYHGVEVTRSVALGVPAQWPVAAHVAYLAAWLVAGWIVAVRVLEKRLKP